MADDSVGMVIDEAYRTGYADGLAAMREKALLLPDQMAVAWGGDASWLTTGERVASLVLDWLREELQS